MEGRHDDRLTFPSRFGKGLPLAPIHYHADVITAWAIWGIKQRTEANIMKVNMIAGQ